MNRARAERDYTHGRYQAAARSWECTHATASTPNDRNEALYRAASAYRRGGNLEKAKQILVRLLEEAPTSARAPRAAYDLSLIEIEQGFSAKGEARLQETVRRYPHSALASRAAEQLFERVRSRAGNTAALKLLNSMIAGMKQPELVEKLRYKRARVLHDMGKKTAALAAYLRLARDFPYPEGAYWDDALWYAAELEHSAGRPRRALALLQRMLKELEPAHFQGSYTRARYAQAQYRIAEIYRDDLEQHQLAQRSFRRVFEEHVTSLLRDDALWQEALTATQAGDAAAACAAASLLARRLPSSRYAACAPLVCPAIASGKAEHECRAYIRRSLVPAPAGHSSK